MWSVDVERSADRRWTARLWIDATGGSGAGLYVRGAWVVFDTLTAAELARVPYSYSGDDAVSRVELVEDATGLVVRTLEHPPWGGRRVVAQQRFAVPVSLALTPETAPHLVFTTIAAELATAVDSLRGRRGGEPSWVRASAPDRIAVLLAGEPESEVMARLALDQPARMTLDDATVAIEEVHALSAPGRMQVRIAFVPVPSADVRVRFADRDAVLAPSAVREWIDVPIDDAARPLLARIAPYPLPPTLVRTA